MMDRAIEEMGVRTGARLWLPRQTEMIRFRGSGAFIAVLCSFFWEEFGYTE